MKQKVGSDNTGAEYDLHAQSGRSEQENEEGRFET